MTTKDNIWFMGKALIWIIIGGILGLIIATVFCGFIGKQRPISVGCLKRAFLHEVKSVRIKGTTY